MVSLHKPDSTSVMNIIIAYCHWAALMQINRKCGKCGLACETNYLSARYTIMGLGPTQRGPTLVTSTIDIIPTKHVS